MTRRWLLASLIVFAVALIAVALFVVPRMPQRTSTVTLPKDNATPEQVVSAYLAALNANDCTTATATTNIDYRERASSWCQEVGALEGVKVQNHVVVARDGAEPIEVDVPVTFSLEWRLGHRDVSMPEGRTQWGYVLKRDNAQEPWRICDDGVA